MNALVIILTLAALLVVVWVRVTNEYNEPPPLDEHDDPLGLDDPSDYH